MLPPKSEEYNFAELSAAETAAFSAALGDGYGAIGAIGSRLTGLPTKVRSGLLKHHFSTRAHTDWSGDELEDEFWESKSDEPPLSAEFPLGFRPELLRLFFHNQFDRFCHELSRRDPPYEGLERSGFEADAAILHYEKPWYEFHAMQLLDFIDEAAKMPHTRGREAFRTMLIVAFAGQLGRLVEQYFWRFHFEKLAITGGAARAGASAGGKSRAERFRQDQRRWQRAATDIWQRRPELTKIAVATSVRKRLQIPHTVKHIARFIRRP